MEKEKHKLSKKCKCKPRVDSFSKNIRRAKVKGFLEGFYGKCTCNNVAGDNRKCKMHNSKMIIAFRKELTEMIEFCLGQGSHPAVMREAILAVIKKHLG